MTGWRLGWLVLPGASDVAGASMTDALARLIEFNT